MCAIRRVHDGESKAAVARDIGVPESTLRGWCKSEHKILNQMKNMGNYEQAPASEHESGDSDTTSHRGSPANSNLPTNANIPSTSTARDPTTDELEAGPSAKRMRVENAMPTTSNGNVGTLAGRGTYNGEINGQNLLQNPNLYNLLANSDVSNIIAIQEHLAILQKQNLMSFLSTAVAPAAAVPSTSSSAVGLIENGLQYINNRSNGVYPINPNKKKNCVNTSSHIQETSRSSTSRRQSSSPAMERFPAIAGTSRSSTPLTSTGLVNGTHAEPSTSRTGTRQDGKTLETIPLSLSIQQYMQEQLEQQLHCLNQIQQQRAAGQPISQEITNQMYQNYYNLHLRLSTMSASQGQLSPRQLLETCISNPIGSRSNNNSDRSSSSSSSNQNSDRSSNGNNGGGASSSSNTSNNGGNGSNENNNNAQEANNNETVQIRAKIEKAVYHAEKLLACMEGFGSQCFSFQDVQNVQKVKKFLQAWDVRLVAGNGKRSRSSS